MIHGCLYDLYITAAASCVCNESAVGSLSGFAARLTRAGLTGSGAGICEYVLCYIPPFFFYINQSSNRMWDFDFDFILKGYKSFFDFIGLMYFEPSNQVCDRSLGHFVLSVELRTARFNLLCCTFLKLPCKLI